MNRIGFWRREREISQEHLSMATGIPRQRLSLIERQYTDPNEKEAKAISTVLKVEVRKLVKRGCDGRQEELLLDNEEE